MVAGVPLRAISTRITQCFLVTQYTEAWGPSSLNAILPLDWPLYPLLSADKVVNQKPTKITHLSSLHVCTYTDFLQCQETQSDLLEGGGGQNTGV